jgi:hypothetical protein
MFNCTLMPFTLLDAETPPTSPPGTPGSEVM